MLIMTLLLFLALLWLSSDWLVKLGWMTSGQRDKLKGLLSGWVKKEFFIILLISVSVALAYLAFFLFNGGLAPITGADLPRLTVGRIIRFDDLGLAYCLSGWWNILFLVLWLNMMRYLYQIIYRFRFPFSGLDYSSYSLLMFLVVIMAYFSFAGGSPLYGFLLSLMALGFYTLTHVLLSLIAVLRFIKIF